MEPGFISDDFLAECREDIETFLHDTCDIYKRGSATSDGRGGITAATSAKTILHSNVPCRIQSVRMKISMGEAVVGSRVRSQDEMLLCLPYDKVITNECIVTVTTRDGFTDTYEITQQMEQTNAFTRLFSVVRIS